MNIYVGNLAYSTTQDELKELFEAYGSVSRATIISDRDSGRSKGFGFVEMDNKEDGDKAIEALDGQDVGGRGLRVNEAQPRENKPRRSGGGGGGGGGGRW